MERPVSIVWFERCYLGSLVVGLVNTALSWNTSLEAASTKLAENPQTAQMGGSFASSMMIGGTIFTLLISLLLWYFSARKGSVVTKWIIVIFFVLGLLGLATTVVQRTFPHGVSAVLLIAGLVLNAIAVWQLFKPDTKLWFGETA